MPVPLHVFEPRYRTMVGDVRGGHGIIGIVLLRPGWEPIYDGRPPVFHIGCAGRLEQCEALPDGRYDILLRGVTRFTILEEDAGGAYRVASVRPRPDLHGDGADLEAARSELTTTLDQADEQDVLALRGPLPPDLFVNALCQSLDLTPIERQSLLDCDEIAARCRRLNEILAFKRLERGGTSRRFH